MPLTTILSMCPHATVRANTPPACGPGRRRCLRFPATRHVTGPRPFLSQPVLSLPVLSDVLSVVLSLPKCLSKCRVEG